MIHSLLFVLFSLLFVSLGALQGLSKERTADRLGREKVMKWRRSYDVPPPAMTEDHPHYDIINNDSRYRHLALEERDGGGVPRAESLADCQKRVVEAWHEILRDGMEAEDTTATSHSLIVAHANTLRALVMHIDDIPASAIEDLNIPTGIPFYYNICKTTGKVLEVEDAGHPDVDGFRGVYITDDRKKRSFLERRRAANKNSSEGRERTREEREEKEGERRRREEEGPESFFGRYPLEKFTLRSLSFSPQGFEFSLVTSTFG